MIQLESKCSITICRNESNLGRSGVAQYQESEFFCLVNKYDQKEKVLSNKNINPFYSQDKVKLKQHDLILIAKS